MLDLADRVGRLVGGSSGIVFERPSDRLGEGYQDIARRVPDPSLARAVLGWAPTTTLDVGLARTVEWARSAMRG